MKIGIYGGTFNPPHLGHMASAREAVKALGLDKLFFVPAALPPHKELPKGSADGADRYAMTELMADGLGRSMERPDDVACLDLELRRPGRSYTADTLAELHERYPEDEFWLLVGADMFLTLQDWYEPRRIMELAGVAAFARSEGDVEAIAAQARRLAADYGARIHVVELPQITEASSTALRAALAEGAGSGQLWAPVYGYILRKGLYGVGKDLKRLNDDELRAASYSMIRAKRIPHIRGTEETAVALAERWGADVGMARRAAILHDCTKYLTMEEQLKLCAEYGVVLDELEQKAEKLLHAKTGACIAKYVFGEPDEVCWAIFWHTTGRAKMTKLEKILYLADYMEPTRNFPGVERLRFVAGESLESGVMMGLQMSIQEMAARGKTLHHNTVEALDWLMTHRA